jgi:predicted phosphoribosyltransferase
MVMIFKDRRDAGRQLAEKLAHFRGNPNVVVLALPRGGVPVAYEIAEALDAPLDVFIVRKLGVPGHDELAMGAIASGGTFVLNEEVVWSMRVPPEMIDMVAERELRELRRREDAYRQGQPPIDLYGKTVILVDDGLATGASMRAAVQALKEHLPKKVVVAVPVGSEETCEQFRDEVNDVVCAATPEPFYAVGMWYQDFSQTSDDEVRELLRARDAEPAHEH